MLSLSKSIGSGHVVCQTPFYNFVLIILKRKRCFSHGLKVCMWFVQYIICRQHVATFFRKLLIPYFCQFLKLSWFFFSCPENVHVDLDTIFRFVFVNFPHIELSHFITLYFTRDIYPSVTHTLYLLSPRLCFFTVPKRVLFVYRDDSLTS